MPKTPSAKRLRKCSVPQCTTKDYTGFHCFPANPDLRAKWQNVCQLPELMAGNRNLVCQRHFEKHDYEIAPGTLDFSRLNIGACPSLHLPKTESTSDLSHSESSTDPPTFVVKVEENVIALDTIKCSMRLCSARGFFGEFHPFPPKNSDLRVKWQNICQLSKVNLTSCLCRRHFCNSDYVITPGTLNDLRLKTGAFPVLHVPKSNILSNNLKRKCSVPLCTTKGSGGFHRFPSNPENRAKWLNICQLSEHKTTSIVCKRHFDKSDYITYPGTLTNSNVEIMTRLKKGACPVLHVPKNESTNDLSHFDSTMDQLTFEENVIAQDTINVFNEDIKPCLEIDLHDPNESTNANRHRRKSYCESSMDPLTCVVKVEEIVIAPDPINILNEDITPSLKIGNENRHRRKCSVPLCTTKGFGGGFHTFPLNPEIRAKWQNICQVSTVKSTSYVCQCHFDKSDYMNYIGEHNHINEERRARLKTGACPSLHVPENESTNDLSHFDSTMDPLTFEENVIAQDTINVFNEDIKPCLEIGAFPLDLNVPNELTNANRHRRKCAVSLCTTKGFGGGFHCFPVNPDLMAKWKNICQVSVLKSTSYVCQRHFHKSDYVIAPGTLNDFNEEMKVKLKKGACPSLHLPKNESIIDLSHSESSTDQQTFEVREVEENVIALDTINLFNEDMKPSLKIGDVNRHRRKCSVPLCTTKGAGGGFHTFPANPDLRAKWQNICQVSTVKSTSYVCQCHFDTSDYQIAPGTLNFVNEEMKVKLKKGACPSLHVPKNESTNDLSHCDSTMDPLTCVVKVEENVMYEDTINVLNEDIKPSLQFGAFPVVLHVPDESIIDDSDSSMDPLAVSVKMEN
jgi:hypothetical protein